WGGGGGVGGGGRPPFARTVGSAAAVHGASPSTGRTARPRLPLDAADTLWQIFFRMRPTGEKTAPGQLDFGCRMPARRRKKRLGRPPKPDSGVPPLPPARPLRF